MQLGRIESKRKSQLVAEMLLQMIQNESYLPGAKLPPEREISEAMNVSRNTLREAVAALEVLGILEVRRSHGIFVAQPLTIQQTVNTPKNLADLFAENQDPFAVITARLAFEPGVALLAAAETTDSEILQFGGIINEMRTALEMNEQEKYMYADCRFHLTIARLTKNPFILSTMEQLIDSLSNPLWRAMKRSLCPTTSTTERLAEHLAIFSAIASRNEQEILRSVREHLENSKQRFL